MAKASNLSIRIDSETKAQAEILFSQFGITISDAVNIFLHQSINYGGIPFELRIDPFYSLTNQTRLLAAKERMEKTGGTARQLVEVEDD